jgi:hypothetical protein
VSTHDNLLGVPATFLPDDAAPRDALAAGVAPSEVAAAHPATSLPWATLAEQALAGQATAGQPTAADGAASVARAVEGYAYARVGYHRGLDALRRAGWRGQGPVPWSHEPNQGFLRALAALGRAASAAGSSSRTATRPPPRPSAWPDDADLTMPTR